MNLMIRFSALCGILILSIGCGGREKDDKPLTQKEILLQLQHGEWRRDPDTKRWLDPYILSKDVKIRRRAVLAAGRMGHAPSYKLLVLSLKDDDPKVRQNAVFAIRLIILESGFRLFQLEEIREALIERLKDEKLSAIRDSLLKTFGWIAQVDNLLLIEKEIKGKNTKAAIIAWGLMARRGIVQRHLSQVFHEILIGKDSEQKKLALWALFNAKAMDRFPVLADIRHLGEDKNESTEVRRFAVAVVASEINTTHHTSWLIRRFKERDPIIQVEAAKGLAFGNRRAHVRLTAEIKAVWNQVGANHSRLIGRRVHAVTQGMRALKSHASIATVKTFTEDMLELSDASDAAIRYGPLQALSIDLVHCEAARLWDLGTNRIERTALCGTAHAKQLDASWRKIHVVRTIHSENARDAGWKLTLLRRYFRDRDPSVAAEALKGLKKVDSSDLGVVIAHGLDAEDPSIVRSAAEVAKEENTNLLFQNIEEKLFFRLQHVNPIQKPELATSLIEALAAFRYPISLPYFTTLLGSPVHSVRKSARDAIENVGQTLPKKVERFSRGLPDLHWHREENKPLPTKAILVLERGEVEIELFPELAPVAVASFARRAGRHEYKGRFINTVKPFERIEFGGRRDWHDPTPNRIPSEFNEGRFERGTLAMLLPEGKDSAGARFFIVLREDPSLEGRRTRFGKIKKGLEIIESLHEGEKIIDLYIPK